LPALAKHFKETLPPTIEEFIASGEKALCTAEALLRKAENSTVANVSAPLNEVALLAPIASPPKIICLGLNYIDHAAETNKTVPDEPVIFIKPHTTIIGPNQNIVKPHFVHELDYEGELAIHRQKSQKHTHIRSRKTRFRLHHTQRHLSTGLSIQRRTMDTRQKLRHFRANRTINNHRKPTPQHR